MSLEYRFDYVNLQPTATLENLTQKRLRSLEKRVGRRANGMVEVRVRFIVDTRSPYGDEEGSHVVMNVKVPGIRKRLVVTKRDSNLKIALNRSCDALLKEVTKYTKKAEHIRRQAKMIA